MNKDLKKIKKLYGEKMMHLCRELFPTLLEQEGLLNKILVDNFYPTRFLYNDIIDSNNVENFKNYIYSIANLEKPEQVISEKSSKELLEKAGYDLYECKTEEEIQSFKKYYASMEELCTFNGGRLDRCHVFFAVKKNVDEIKREDFLYPKREDEYGTSVISIQFTRGVVNTLSIKNRYNHTVDNPDATYSNNLENIMPGLTHSFEKEYKLCVYDKENKKFELPGYIKINDGKYYKYNYEINNKYYCPNNIIIDSDGVKQLELEKYIVLDYFILDLVNKKIMLYDNNIKDSFIDGIKEIEKIQITKKSDVKIIEMVTYSKNYIIIELDKTNKITGYKNKDLNEIGDKFLHKNISLESITIPNVSAVGDEFLSFNKNLKELEMLNLISAGGCFLAKNVKLNKLSLPKLTKVSYMFLSNNEGLTRLEFPDLIEVSTNFLAKNESLEYLNLPNLIVVSDNFLYSNKTLKTLDLPKLEKIGDCFLYCNEILFNLNLPNLVKVGSQFLYNNKGLIKLKLPKLEDVRREFLVSNEILTSLSLPQLKNSGSDFLTNNTNLFNVELSNLVELRHNFLPKAKKIININLPNLDYRSQLFLGDRFKPNDVIPIEKDELYENPIKKIKLESNLEEKIVVEEKKKNKK